MNCVLTSPVVPLRFMSPVHHEPGPALYRTLGLVTTVCAFDNAAANVRLFPVAPVVFVQVSPTTIIAGSNAWICRLVTGLVTVTV